jgi:hypothetical protein
MCCCFFSQLLFIEDNFLFFVFSFCRLASRTYPWQVEFAKSPSTEWSWFCIELIILFHYLLCSWIIAIFKECLNKSIPMLYSFVWQDRSSHPQSIALEASTLTITLPMRFPIFIELTFAKSPSTEWSWFCIELIILFLYLLCSWIITICRRWLGEYQFCTNRFVFLPFNVIQNIHM